MSYVELQFVAANGWASGAIEYFGAGGFSHVDNVVPKGLLGARSDHAGGQPPGVWVRPQWYAKWRRRVRIRLRCTEGQHQRWLAFLKGEIGKPYDRMAILAFAVGRDWRTSDAWICSELAAAALESAGIIPRLILTPNKITPGALALAVSAAGGMIV